MFDILRTVISFLYKIKARVYRKCISVFLAIIFVFSLI